jgi:hypothetical protein
MSLAELSIGASVEPENSTLKHPLAQAAKPSAGEKILQEIHAPSIYSQRDVLLGGYFEYGCRAELNSFRPAAVFGGGAERSC